MKGRRLATPQRTWPVDLSLNLVTLILVTGRPVSARAQQEEPGGTAPPFHDTGGETEARSWNQNPGGSTPLGSGCPADLPPRPCAKGKGEAIPTQLRDSRAQPRDLEKWENHLQQRFAC